MPLLTISAPGYYEITNDMTQTNPNDHAIYINPGVHYVTIVLKARLVGLGSPASVNCGIYAPYSAALNLIGMGGNIRGFQYAVRGDYNYLANVRDIYVQDATFRGICMCGDDMTLASNNIRNVTGCTAYPDAFCFGIEVSGHDTTTGCPKVIDNFIQDAIGMGQGEGVGISFTDKSIGGICSSNVVRCTKIAPPKTNGESAGYGLWVGGQSNVIAAHNIFENWGVGGAYSSPTSGFIDDNAIKCCTVAFMPGNTTVVVGQNQ